MSQGVILTTIGMVILTVSIAAGRMDAVGDGGAIWVANWVAFLFGSILVIVGVVRIVTIDRGL